MKTTVEILNSNDSASCVILIISYVISIIWCRSSNSCQYKNRQPARNNSLRVKKLPLSEQKYFHKIWTDYSISKKKTIGTNIWFQNILGHFIADIVTFLASDILCNTVTSRVACSNVVCLHVHVYMAIITMWN